MGFRANCGAIRVRKLENREFLINGACPVPGLRRDSGSGFGFRGLVFGLLGSDLNQQLTILPEQSGHGPVI